MRYRSKSVLPVHVDTQLRQCPLWGETAAFLVSSPRCKCTDRVHMTPRVGSVLAHSESRSVHSSVFPTR